MFTSKFRFIVTLVLIGSFGLIVHNTVEAQYPAGDLQYEEGLDWDTLGCVSSSVLSEGGSRFELSEHPGTITIQTDLTFRQSNGNDAIDRRDIEVSQLPLAILFEPNRTEEDWLPLFNSVADQADVGLGQNSINDFGNYTVAIMEFIRFLATTGSRGSGLESGESFRVNIGTTPIAEVTPSSTELLANGNWRLTYEIPWNDAITAGNLTYIQNFLWRADGDSAYDGYLYGCYGEIDIRLDETRAYPRACNDLLNPFNNQLFFTCKFEGGRWSAESETCADTVLWPSCAGTNRAKFSEVPGIGSTTSEFCAPCTSALPGGNSQHHFGETREGMSCDNPNPLISINLCQRLLSCSTDLNRPQQKICLNMEPGGLDVGDRCRPGQYQCGENLMCRCREGCDESDPNDQVYRCGFPANSPSELRTVCDNPGELCSVNPSYRQLEDNGYTRICGDSSGDLVCEARRQVTCDNKTATATRLNSEVIRVVIESCLPNSVEEISYKFGLVSYNMASSDQKFFVRRDGKYTIDTQIYVGSIDRILLQPRCLSNENEGFVDCDELYTFVVGDIASGGDFDPDKPLSVLTFDGVNNCALRTDDPEEAQRCFICVGEGNTWTALGCIATTPQGILSTVTRIGIGTMAGVALLRLIYLGFIYQSLDETQIAEARKGVVSTLVAIVLILFSILILEIIGVNILDIVPTGFFTS